MNFEMSQLNEEQLVAVLQTEGAVMVTAGAGSGKTRLLTHRIAHLILNNNISPYNILAITFTNKAASEMKERLIKMVPAAEKTWICTFHSMCVRILRMFIDKIGFSSNFSIYGEDEKERAVKNLVKKYNYDPEEYLKKIMWGISDAKNKGLMPDDYSVTNKYDDNIDVICRIYREYQQELKNNNALDFDDLLLTTFNLLKTDEQARSYCQDRFMYVHVDEFQDTNAIQYKLVKIIAAKYKNILVVGDEDQCIYGWRGADIKNIYDFKTDFNCNVYKLEQNYRSTKKVLEMANKLIANNSSRIDKKLWTDNADGEEIEYLVTTTEGNEADNVVYKINKLVSEQGYKYSDIAILMRLNALSRSFEERLIQYAIPHKIFGGFKFFERKEIKDILAYLKLLSNPQDNDAIVRIINFPKRGIGDNTVSELLAYAQKEKTSLYDVVTAISSNKILMPAVLRKVSPFATLLKDLAEKKRVLPLTEMVQYLVKMLNLATVYADDTEENISRKKNIDEFVNSVKSYEDENPETTLEEYLQMITLYTDTEEMSDSNNCINIATVHSAKGLEFKVVFVVGLEENIFPITRAQDSTNDLEEERRLLYVAITRAKERLFLTRATSRFLYGVRKPTYSSRFLKELGLEVKSDTRPARAPAPKPTYHPITPPIVPTAQLNTGLDLSLIKIGSKLQHRKFGIGVVKNLTNEHNSFYAEIEFPIIGNLNLALAFAPLTLIES